MLKQTILSLFALLAFLLPEQALAASAYTTCLRLENPVPGDPAVANTWGTIENTGRSLVDTAVAAPLALSVAGSSDVILTSNNGAADQSRSRHYTFSGVLTGSITVYWPQFCRAFSVTNSTTGAFTLRLAVNNGSGSPRGTTYTIAQGHTLPFTSNGTDIAADLTLPLPAVLGGTGLSSFTSGGIPYFASSTTIASSAALAANRIVLGGGAGTTPATLGSLGTTTTLLHGNAAGAPTFGAVSLTADVTGTLPVANGGTGAASFTSGQVLVGSGTSAIAVVSAGTSGQVLTSNGSSAPTWQSGPTGTVTSVATGTGLTGGTITSTGTISLASISDLRVMANISGGSAAPIANTMTGILDATIGSTRGSLLERGASGWTVLTPGTANYGLLSGGSGADPSYVQIPLLNGTTAFSALQTFSAGASITPAAAPATTAVGYLGAPQNTQNTDYGIVMTDAGKMVYHSSASTHTYTIPANGSVAFPIGTKIEIVNDNGGGNVTIAITTDTLRWIPTGSAGSRTLAANGSAIISKITATSWQIMGINLS